MSDTHIHTLQEQHDNQAKAMNHSNKDETKIENNDKLNYTSSPKPFTSGKSKSKCALNNLEKSSSDDDDGNEPCCACQHILDTVEGTIVIIADVVCI